MALADRTGPTAEEYAAWRTTFCNWGRWGPDDELGTLNFVTPEVRRVAATLVRDGRSVSMARPINTVPGPNNPFPAHHFVACEGAGGVLDYIGMFIHGLVQTHIDGLCHMPTTDGRFWNGHPIGTANMPVDHSGTIDFWSDGMVSRGVLYDIPRLRGTDYVERGEPVTGWDLVDAAAAQGVEPRAGDVVIIRSGWGRYVELHPDRRSEPAPTGVHVSAVEFLHDTEAAMLCWDWLDAPIDQQGIPNPEPHGYPVHLHHVLLPYMGMPIIDNADLEAVARACADLDRWEFQFVCAPLVIPRGTGSPVNPLAVF